MTYTFSIDGAAQVFISTDNPITSFLSKVHLVRLARNGEYVDYLAGSEESAKGKLAAIILRPGRFAVIVEGLSEQDQGDFQVVLMTKTLDDRSESSLVQNTVQID